MTVNVGDNRYGVAQLIVAPTIAEGANYTTIAAALTAAISGQTIFIRPGTYTENITLKAGVNLTAFNCDAFTPNVTISGTCTFTTAGSVTISGVRLQTNSNFAIAVTGSAASVLNLVDCYLNFSNNTGISFTSSSASSKINVIKCNGNIGTTGITIYAMSGAGVLFFDRSYIENSGASTTASTSSSGFVFWQYTYTELPMTTSSTSVMTGSFSYFSTFSTNTLTLTQGGSALNLFRSCSFKSGSATPITISTSLNLQDVQIETTNADVVAGAGTLTYSMLTVNNTVAWGLSVTTKVVKSNGPDVTIGSATSGGTNTFTLQNESNTANSFATIKCTTAGATAADARYSASTTTTEWSFGVDNSVTTPSADPFVISQGAALGTNNIMSVATSGEINYPLQPAFLTVLGTTDSNVTGDATYYLLGQGNALTEIYDQGADITTAGVFTAPVTGRYNFSGVLYISGLTASHTSGWIEITASNRSPTSNYLSPAACKTAGSEMVLGISMSLDMDAADTCSLRTKVENGTKVVDIIGGASSAFSGFLEC